MIKMIEEINLKDFEFWDSAVSVSEELITTDFDTIENNMDGIKSEWTSNDINDFFCFEEDTIAEWLGYRNWKSLVEERNED